MAQGDTAKWVVFDDQCVVCWRHRKALLTSALVLGGAGTMFLWGEDSPVPLAYFTPGSSSAKGRSSDTTVSGVSGTWVL